MVLMLAAGQSVSLLCDAWCHDGPPAACPHDGSTASTRVSSDDSCSSAGAGTAVFVREDARRNAAPDPQQALVVPRFLFAFSPPGRHPGFERGRQLPLEARPLIVALRI